MGTDPKRGPTILLPPWLDSIPYMDREFTYYEGGTIKVPHHQSTNNEDKKDTDGH